MASVYPAALDTLATNKQDDTDAKTGADLGLTTTTGDHATHHNNLADAVNKIEAELGVDPSGASATVASRFSVRDGGSPNVVYASEYGVKADGRYVVDLVTTAGSAIVTSATAAFTAADVGKLILIMRAGTSNVSFSSTILSRQSATQVTLAANVPSSGTNPAWFGTDDTAAVQASIDAAFGTNGMGPGDVLLPRGMIMVGGALRHTATVGRTGTPSDYKYNAQLVIPAWDSVSDTRIQLRIRGPMPCGNGIGGGTSGGPYFGPLQGTSIISTITSATIDGTYQEPSIVGGPTSVVPNSPYGQFTNIGVILENLRIFAPQNPQLGAVDFGRCNHAKIKECMIGTTMLPGTPSAAIPTVARSFGVRMPVVYSSSPSCIRDTFVYGFYCGVAPGEHTVMDNLNVFTAEIGIAPCPSAGHMIYGGYVMTEFLNYAVAGWDSTSGVVDIQSTTYMQIDCLDCEVNVAHLKDASHNLHGTLRIMNNAGSTVLNYTGGGNCNIIVSNGAKMPGSQAGGGPGQIPLFVVANRPAANSVPAWGIIAVIDAAAGSKLQYSDGSNWQPLG